MAQNIISAPQSDSIPSLYSDWSADHDGNLSDFFSFLTTPSVERTQWLKARTRNVSFDGPYCLTKYS